MLLLRSRLIDLMIFNMTMKMISMNFLQHSSRALSSNDNSDRLSGNNQSDERPASDDVEIFDVTNLDSSSTHQNKSNSKRHHNDSKQETNQQQPNHNHLQQPNKVQQSQQQKKQQIPDAFEQNNARASLATSPSVSKNPPTAAPRCVVPQRSLGSPLASPVSDVPSDLPTDLDPRLSRRSHECKMMLGEFTASLVRIHRNHGNRPPIGCFQRQETHPLNTSSAEVCMNLGPLNTSSAEVCMNLGCVLDKCK